MNKKKVVSKGYTVEVVSWENDGDNYKTETHTYESKEEALTIKKMCEILFRSCNNGDGGIGNMTDYNSPKPIITEYIIQNPEILNFKQDSTKPSDLEEAIKLAFPEETKEIDWSDLIHDYIETTKEGEEIYDNWHDIVMDYNWQLLGGSEYYASRIAESVTIYYSPKDVYLEEIIA